MEDIRKYNHIDLLFPSKYAKAADLRGRRVSVVIEKIDPREELTMQGGRRDHKPVVYMKGKEKGWILNKTNARRIAKVYGPELTNWIGKTVVIYSEKVEAKGEEVDAIRVDVDATRKHASGAQVEAHDPDTGEVTEESPAQAEA